MNGEINKLESSKNSRQVLISEFLLLILAMIWGGTFVAGKFALETISPFLILTIRFFVSTAILGAIFFKKLKELNRNDVKYGAIIGFLLFLGIAVQMTGLKYTSPANQTFILVTYVIIVPILNWIIRKEIPERKVLIAAVIMIIGVGLVSLDKELRLNIGDILTLVYAVIFSLQLVLISLFIKKVNPIPFTISQLLLAGIFSLIAMLLFELPLSGIEITNKSYFGLFYLTVLNTAVAFLIQNIAQRHARPANAALIMATESVFGALAAYFFVGEIFTTQKILGCILIIISIILTKVDFNKIIKR